MILSPCDPVSALIILLDTQRQSMSMLTQHGIYIFCTTSKGCHRFRQLVVSSALGIPHLRIFYRNMRAYQYHRYESYHQCYVYYTICIISYLCSTITLPHSSFDSSFYHLHHLINICLDHLFPFPPSKLKKNPFHNVIRGVWHFAIVVVNSRWQSTWDSIAPSLTKQKQS